MTTNFAAHAEKIAKAYWGEPNAKLSGGKQLRWGTHGSRSLDLNKGTWFDYEENTGGGVVDLVRLNAKRTITGNIADILERDFGIAKTQQKALEPRGRYVEKVYEYYNADGVLAYQIERTVPKGFRQRRPDPDRQEHWLYNMKGVTPLPYNLVGMMAEPTAPVFVVEGEKCAQRLIDLGLVATTNHGGSKNWSDDLAQWFDGRRVVVIPDNDQAGHAHADKVIRSLWPVAGGIKHVVLDGLADKGDVIDWLFAGNTVNDLMQAVSAVPAMTALPDEVVEDDAAEDDQRPVFRTLDQDAVWSMPPVEFLIDDLIPERSLAMMYGPPGSGKSFLAIDMALSVAHGVEFAGQETKKAGVIYIVAEGVAGFGKRWKAWQSAKQIADKAPLIVLPEAVNLMDDEQVDKLIDTLDSVGNDFSLTIIDTVHRTMHGAEENSASEMARFITACAKIQEHTGGAVLAVHHSGKNSAQGARGSNSLLGAVDASLAITKSETSVTLMVEKQKDAEPIEGGMHFEMDTVPVGISETSVVMRRVDEVKAKRDKGLAPAQRLALQALRNLMVDLGAAKVPNAAWDKAHERHCPDTARSSRSTARSRLQEMGVVVRTDDYVWINKDLDRFGTE